MLFGSVGQKPEVTDAHKAVRQDVKQEAADEFMGPKRDRRFQPSLSFSISITQGDLTVLDRKDALVGQRDAVGVAAEVIKHGLWRAERLFGVDHPVLLAICFDLFSRWDFSFAQACCNRSRNFPRNTRLRALTGNRKFGRASIQRL